MSINYQVIPLTEAPSQSLIANLSGQSCTIRVYTKSINVPYQSPDVIPTDPPTYQNVDPLFLDLSIVPRLGGDLTPVVLGVICHHANRIVRDTYLGFIGDLAFYDLQGTDDPFGVPRRFPPYYLQNTYQLEQPRTSANRPADTSILGVCPGLGSRFILTYWPDLT